MGAWHPKFNGAGGRFLGRVGDLVIGLKSACERGVHQAGRKGVKTWRVRHVQLLSDRSDTRDHHRSDASRDTNAESAARFIGRVLASRL